MIKHRFLSQLYLYVISPSHTFDKKLQMALMNRWRQGLDIKSAHSNGGGSAFISMKTAQH